MKKANGRHTNLELAQVPVLAFEEATALLLPVRLLGEDLPELPPPLFFFFLFSTLARLARWRGSELSGSGSASDALLAESNASRSCSSRSRSSSTSVADENSESPPPPPPRPGAGSSSLDESGMALERRFFFLFGCCWASFDLLPWLPTDLALVDGASRDDLLARRPRSGYLHESVTEQARNNHFSLVCPKITDVFSPHWPLHSREHQLSNKLNYFGLVMQQTVQMSTIPVRSEHEPLSKNLNCVVVF